jgi:stress response protein YsnF
VERVAVNRYIEEPVAIRREKEKTIIPVLEEVLVVEKRLLLKEELHVSKRTTEVRNPQEAVVRSEEVEIENMAVAGQSKKKTEQ